MPPHETTSRDLFPDAGKQMEYNGETYTLATYALSAWMKTDDYDEAQRMLQDKLDKAFGQLRGVFHVDGSGKRVIRE